MPLASAQGDAPLPHQGFVAIGKALDVGLEAGLLGSPLNPGERGLGGAVTEVFGQRGRKQEPFLGHQSHQPAQIRQAEAGDVVAIDPKLSAGHFHHATQGPGQGGFAATYRPHDGHKLPRGHRETHVQECRPGGARIGDGETAGFDAALARRALVRRAMA